MGIVIDINTLAPVFNGACEQHNDFHPVKHWIESGRGFLVFGGTRYKLELERANRYRRLIIEMKKIGQAIAISDDLVDNAENEIINKTIGTSCNDQHIIAILCVSRVGLCCTLDIKSHKFIKDKCLYPDDMCEIKIYSSRKHFHLLKPISRDRINNQV